MSSSQSDPAIVQQTADGATWINTPPVTQIGRTAAIVAAKGLVAATAGQERVGTVPDFSMVADGVSERVRYPAYAYAVAGPPAGLMVLDTASAPATFVYYLGTVNSLSVIGTMVEHALNAGRVVGPTSVLRLIPAASATEALGQLGFVTYRTEMRLEPVSSDVWRLVQGQWRRPIRGMAHPGVTYGPNGWSWGPYLPYGNVPKY